MPRIFQILMLAAGLTLGVRQTAAFSLAGPFEDWQVTGLGYNLPGDIVAPKNLTEEYRWNQPVITYGFDAPFVNYFGTNGMAAIDEAFGILNRSMETLFSGPLTNSLFEFPLDAARVNYRARTLNLIDLKSVMLGFMMEQLGLAPAERWVWALYSRTTPPEETNYFVIQRNFDPFKPENPSRYVNGTRYTYRVLEFDQPVQYADAVEFTINDPEMIPYTSLSSIPDLFINMGVFYNSITRDDAGGLRYIYSTNNYNVELPPPGTQVFSLDFGNLTVLTNLDLTLLSLRSLTNTPAEISNAYPGIIIEGAIPRATNLTARVPVISTQQVPVLFFTNRTQPVIFTNIPLRLFSLQSLTNPPAALQGLYPNLVITSTNAYLTSVVEVASVVVTNGKKFPWGDPFQTNFVLFTNFVTNLTLNYNYTYRNVVTNYFSPVTEVRTVVTGLEKLPWSDPLDPEFVTTVETSFETIPSGGITILPPGVAGLERIPGFAATNIITTTNIVLTNSFVSGNVLFNVLAFEVRSFTNVQFGAFPIEFVTNGVFTNITSTNFVTNVVVVYDLDFANVVTNYSAPTTPVTTNTFVITTNVFGAQITNLASVEFGQLPVPSGGFLIDTNLTGYPFLAPQFTNVIQVTNVVFDFTDPTGTRTVQEVVYNFTNVLYRTVPFVLTDPEPVLRPGVGPIRFERLNPGSPLGQTFVFTNRYQTFILTNGVLRPVTFQAVRNEPDILITAADLGPNPLVPVQVVRSLDMTNNAALNALPGVGQDAGGPGVISPRSTIAFTKVGPGIINFFPGFNREDTGIPLFFWGSFDGSTNPPIVYPQDITLEDLEFRELSGQ